MTSVRPPFVILTRDAARKIDESPDFAGTLGLDRLDSEDMYVVKTVEVATGYRVQIDIPDRYRTLRWTGPTFAGQWIKGPDPRLHLIHQALLRRPGSSTPYVEFKKLVPKTRHPGNTSECVITYDPNLTQEYRDAGASAYAGWLLTKHEAVPLAMAIEPETIGIEQLASHWPVDELANMRMLVVGVGSIGGVATQALAAYGVGHLELLDPDRLLFHNTVRHNLGPENVGRHKVDAAKAAIEERWPATHVVAHRTDVVEDAHLVRALMDRTDIVLCAADGIAPRRVVSHLARRSGKPAILACVLDDGGYGEVLRLRPGPRFGCLLCQRAHLSAIGGLDAEADQEMDYGANTGHSHRPMTAVGPDLHLVGQLAAKAAVATVLHIRGHDSQRLPGEQAIIGLRPTHGLTAPFDLAANAQIEWHPGIPPRPLCPTCSPA